ncbi:RDD family protein [Nocardioides donggukensis]|uniref:RDD family protein n=1 Tax=Nocardioides donggukensis TaxID=2774019 RepID=A0A927K5D0_9ACTN|nr:RDD family protein [Nocardioides donggukensis]MBD8869435.1 RDD family protein [Nocardioides donggukensis]
MSDYPTYPVGPEQTGPASTEPGRLLERFLARLVDSLLLAVVGGLVIGLVVVGALLDESATGFYGGSSPTAAAVSSVLSTALYLGYYAVMESRQGRTFGKMLLSLRVVGPTGEHPTLEQSLRRNVWQAFGLVGIIPLIGGVIAALLQFGAVLLIAFGIRTDTVARRGWHDQFGETRVLRVR